MPTDEYRQIGERIRDARLAARLTQKELGSQVGVTGSAVTLWETGKNSIGIVELKHIARILRRPLDYFTEGVEVSRLPSQQLRVAAHDQIAALARDGYIPQLAVDWITEILDEVLTRIESGEKSRRTSNL